MGNPHPLRNYLLYIPATRPLHLGYASANLLNECYVVSFQKNATESLTSLCLHMNLFTSTQIHLNITQLYIYGSFRIKSSRVPDITDSDLLEILLSCYLCPMKKKYSPIYLFFGQVVIKIQVVKG